MGRRKIIKRILMCEPKYFEVKYKINPWMKIGSVDKRRAYKQWLELVRILRELEILVDVIEQRKGLPDMVFSADQGIVKGNEILLSNFKFPQRKKESEIYKKWFKEQKLKITELPEDVYFEGGGEGLWFRKKLFIGVGFRAKIRGGLGIGGVWKDTETIPLELINPYFYHLDTALFVLNKETVFYYPEAFSKKSQVALREIVPNLIPIEKKEAFNFAANNLVTDHVVVGQEGNRRARREIEGLGYRAIEVNVSEFMKAGGGIHCLTAVLEEG